jgi:hypothetical protein
LLERTAVIEVVKPRLTAADAVNFLTGRFDHQREQKR